MQQSDRTYSLLSHLLAALEANGYPMGTGKYLQVQELLRHLPADTPPERLKTLLAPVFTRSPEEQTLFYEQFDRIWRDISTLPTTIQPEEQTVEEQAVKKWQKLVYALAALIGITLLVIAIPYFTKESEELTSETISRTISVRDTFSYPIHIPKNDTAAILQATLDSGQVIMNSPYGSYTVDSTGTFFFFADTLAGTLPSVQVELLHHRGKHIATFFLEIIPVPEDTLKNDPTARLATLLSTKPLPYPTDLSTLRIDPKRQQLAQLYQRYGWLAKTALILLLGLLLYAIVQWIEQQRRHIIAQLEGNTKAPYIWRLPLTQSIDIPFSDDFQQTLNQFRQREKSDHFVLHLPQTVQATIRKGGIADFRFVAQTKPPEYLLLIDRQYLDNHRARLYDLLYENFRANEVLVERFFYDGDPKLCYNESYKNGLRLQDLQHRYGERRLLILSDGFSLLSPVSGKLAKWTTLFDTWSDRAILTHQPQQNWGSRERFLEEQFLVLPASLQGLRAAVDYFETDEPINTSRNITDAPIQAIELQGDLIHTLHHYFSKKDTDGSILDDRLVQWIAACAIYPSVQWELTLHIGKTIDEELVTFDNLMQLSRLSWFVEGKMPDATRAILLDYLPEETERQVRERLQQLLTKLPPPPPNSSAAEDYRINQLTNALHLQPENRRELEQELSYHLAAGAEPDLTTLRYLDRPRTKLDFWVPENLRKYVFHEGRPFFGWKAAVWALPMWLVLSSFIGFFNPNLKVCDGEIVEFDGLQLCLSTNEDWITYYDHLSRKYISSTQTATIDSINQKVDSLGRVLSPEQFQNLLQSIQASPENIVQQTVNLSPQEQLLQERAALLQQLKNPMPDSLPITAHQKYYHNLATAYYNFGIEYYNLYQEKVQQLENEFGGALFRQLTLQPTPAQDTLENAVAALKEGSCVLFERAYRFYKKDIDMLDMALWCSTTNDAASTTVRGFVQSTGNEALEGVTVTADLLGSTITTANGGFSFPQLDIPLTTFELQFTKPGYDTLYQLAVAGEETTVTLQRQPDAAIDISSNPPNTNQKTSIPEAFTYEIIRTKAGRQGLQRSDGKVLLTTTYTNIEKDAETGWYRVESPTKFGFYDAEAEQFAIPLQYESLEFFSEGLVAARQAGKWGYLDMRGRTKIQFEYDAANSFRNGEAQVQYYVRSIELSKPFFIDKTGKCIRNCPNSESTAPIENTPAQTKPVCNNLYLDYYAGTLNNLRPTASQEEIKKTLPCFTGSTEEGDEAFNYGGGVFFTNHDFYFYTHRDYLEVRAEYNGQANLNILNQSLEDVFKILGTPQDSITGKGNVIYLFPQKYGCLCIESTYVLASEIRIYNSSCEEVRKREE